MSANKKLLFLNYLIEQSKTSDVSVDELNAVKKLQISLLSAQRTIIDEQELKENILKIKAFIENVERKNPSSKLLANFKQNGLYKTLYHYPVIEGRDDTSMLADMLRSGFYGLGASALAIILFATLPVAAPGWLHVIATSLFAGAMTYVSAIVYGVVNDIFATRANLPYFLLGHQPQQHSMLRSNDPLVQGVAWGVAATFGPALIASIAFGVVTLAVAAFVPVATFIFPLTLVAMPLIAVGAEFYAKRRAQEYAASSLTDGAIGSNDYQWYGLEIMSPTKEEKGAWYANSDRNLFGFRRVPLIGLGALVTMIGLSISHSLLPAILFSASFSVLLPAAAGMFGVLALAGLGAYTYRNRNTQIDNRFKLDFELEGRFGNTLFMDDELKAVFRKMDNDATLSELTAKLERLQPTAQPEPDASPVPVLASQRGKRGHEHAPRNESHRPKKALRK